MEKQKHLFKWTSNIAYAVGLLVTDGSLSIDGRHFDLTSKDVEQLGNFKKCLNLQVKISTKSSSYGRGRTYYHVQFGDVKLYRWLESIGLMSNKTKIISEIKITDKYFFDFLRGHLDGDGCTYSYWDKRWKNSFLIYTTFLSASEKHIIWLRGRIERILKIKGHVVRGKTTFNLRYAKNDSIKLLNKIYYGKNVICLSRKLLKIRRSLSIINQDLNCFL